MSYTIVGKGRESKALITVPPLTCKLSFPLPGSPTGNTQTGNSSLTHERNYKRRHETLCARETRLFSQCQNRLVNELFKLLILFITNCYFLDKIETISIISLTVGINRDQKFFLLHVLFSPLGGLRKKPSYARVRTFFIRQRGLSDQVIAASYRRYLSLGGDYAREHLLFNIY